MTKRRHLHNRILPPAKWYCRVKTVIFSGDSDLSCLGKNPGMNRHPAIRLTLEHNVFLIGVTKQICLNTHSFYLRHIMCLSGQISPYAKDSNCTRRITVNQ